MKVLSNAGAANRPPGHGAVSAVDQARHIFHELHADGRHTFCLVCDSQYGTA